jgi:hypothetical protein
MKDHAASQKVPGGAHLRGVHVGHGEHPAPQEHRDLLGVDPIVLGLPTVDGFHVQGVPQDERDAIASAEIGQPVPGEDALHGHDDVRTVGGDRGEERLRRGLHLPMEEDGALLVQDAHVHRSGVQIDPAVVLVLLGVESHVPPSFDCGEHLRSP